jgi:hypothetical protein
MIAMAGAVACSSREDDPTPTVTAAETPTADSATPEDTAAAGETPTAGPELPAALQEVMERVAELRQLEPLPGLQAELVARADLPALLDRLLTEDDRALMDQTTTLYRLLGHFRQDQDYLSIYQSFGAESILGLYSPMHDTLWVVYDGEEPTFESLSPSEEETLAHEFVHALQDYHFDLDGTYDRVGHEMDRGLAWTSVVEGDASVHDREYSDRYLLRPGAGRFFAFGVVAQVPDVPLTFIRELLFPYTTGATWVDGLIQSEGIEYVDELLVEPPVGTICVLHAQRCLDGFEPAVVELPDLAGGLGDGWTRESGGTLGEFHLGNFLDVELSARDAQLAADGWAGDRYDVYAGDAGTAVVLAIEFADEDEAAEFEAALVEFVEGRDGQWSGSSTRRAVTDDGRGFVYAMQGETRILVAIGSDADIAGRAMDVLQEAP